MVPLVETAKFASKVILKKPWLIKFVYFLQLKCYTGEWCQRFQILTLKDVGNKQEPYMASSLTLPFDLQFE